MTRSHCDAPTLEPRAWPAEYDEAADTDELIRSEIAQLIDRIKVYGRTLPDMQHMGQYVGRYDPLIDALADSQHDWLDGLLPAVR